jgi:uncharacterized protein (TIGR00369 family)
MTPPAHRPSVLSAPELDALLNEVFPQVQGGERVFAVEAAAHEYALVRMIANPRNLRPGNTLSGPSMFTLADLGIYMAVLGTLGRGEVGSVTTNLNITFLSRPAYGDLLAETRLLKVGRKLVVADVAIRSVATPAGAGALPQNSGPLVAHAVGTYARA